MPYYPHFYNENLWIKEVNVRPNITQLLNGGASTEAQAA